MDDSRDAAEDLMSPALLEQVEALAVAEHRPARDVVQDAITLYREQHAGLSGRSVSSPEGKRKAAAKAAGMRIRELRRGNGLPDGETIESLIAFGRA